MRKFKQIFDKVGGFTLVRQYVKSHMLFYVIFTVLFNGFSRKSLEISRLSIEKKILNKLKKMYSKEVIDFKENFNEENLIHKKSNKVWVCWLQGIENAPKLVQICYKSLCDNLTDREIILLTEKNYRNYVQFPEYIQNKIDSGIITKTHFSDLLRIELLIRYGGTWIDSTVLCTGKNIPEYMLNSDLFFFQTLKPGLDGHSTVISSWFMTSCTNNPVLLMCRDLLYKYWNKYDFMMNYFLLHYLFQISLEAYPDKWKNVVPFDNATPHILLLKLFDMYDKDVFNATMQQTPFHKLSYKLDKNNMELSGTFYDFFMKKELSNENSNINVNI